MESRNIVAVEIASSKIKGAVAAVGDDGHLTILAVEEIPATDNVRYGRVQNIRAVSVAVNEILRRLESAPTVVPGRIKSVILSLGGRSMVGMPAKASLKFPSECEITEKQVQRLAFEAAHDFVGEKNIEATVPRMFYVNNSAVRQPVGIFGEVFRGEFVMICCGKETRQNLDRLKIENVDARDIHYVIRPTAVADLVLSADDKALGTALVDIGAETTTVSVYKDGSLAFLCTIPMGSRLITLDLTGGLNITTEAADALKAQYAANSEAVDEIVGAYARARVGEIIANVVNQLELAGFSSSSLSRVVLTGNGAKLEDFADSVKSQTKLPVSRAAMPAEVSFRVAGRNNSDNIDIVALLAAGARIYDYSFVEMPVAETPEEVETPESEDEEPERSVEPEEPVVPRNVRRRPVEVYDDDMDILADDPDDDGREAVAVKSKSSGHRKFFRFGRKSSEQTNVDIDVEAEPYDEYAGQKEEPEASAGNDMPNVGIRIDALKRGFLKIFAPLEYDNDDEDDEEPNDK